MLWDNLHQGRKIHLKRSKMVQQQFYRIVEGSSDYLPYNLSFIMSELPKYINLMIRFGEQIQSKVNKKYRHFIQSFLSKDNLTKLVNPRKICLTKELIIFKLGLQAKSTQAIEISLVYLHELFIMKFVDVNLPNYCQGFVIEQNNVKEVSIANYQKQIRHELVRLIEPLLHFKNHKINLSMLKVLEYLISEPILQILLDLTVQQQHQLAYTIIHNYFSFRFYVYEQIYIYTENQLKSINALSLRNQCFDKEAKAAQGRHLQLGSLICRYMNEYLSLIEKAGGRYGFCVMCNQPAQHYCKITRASLCGLECKKAHLQLAEKQYRDRFQSINLWTAIESAFIQLLDFLQKRQSHLVFTVLANLLDKPHLFMLVKSRFRQIIEEHAPIILGKILNYKNEATFEYIYTFVAALTKYWMRECLPTVQYFFKENILKILEDKRPNFKILILVFKFLAKVFEYGKITVQLYVNFDCEINKLNLIEQIMFEVSKMCQDKFQSNSYYKREEKITIKNSCFSIYQIMASGLNLYRKTQPILIDINDILLLKQKKTNLQKFMMKFNFHWTDGLKTLFNLNLIGLDSNEEIIQIITSLRGLKKENIDQMLFSQKGEEYLNIFFKKITAKPSKIMSLIELYHFIPLQKHSIGIKKLIAYISKEKDESEYINRWVDILLSNTFSQQELKKQLLSQFPYTDTAIQNIYLFALQSKKPLTTGNRCMHFTYCCSKSYLQVIESQIALLQISISHLLENNYDIDAIMDLTAELMQICVHSNWISLLIKSSALEEYPGPLFDELRLRTVTGIFQLIQKYPQFIQDWKSIINFISIIHDLIIKVKDKKLMEGKVSLVYALDLVIVDHCILQISIKIDGEGFSKYILAILHVASEQLEKDNIYMLQKFFEVIDANMKKFISVFNHVGPYLSKFSHQLLKFNAETCIYAADMYKQSFAKLIKTQKSTSQCVDEDIERQFFRMFSKLTENKNRQVCDFVINCVSMTIFYNYELHESSWGVVFDLMKRKADSFRIPIFTIIQKIVKERMRTCQNFHKNLLQICFLQINKDDTKFSIQVLHTIKAVFQIIIQIKTQKQITPDIINYLKNILSKILQDLSRFLDYSCHQGIIQLCFMLLKSSIGNQLLFTIDQSDLFIQKLFHKLQSDYKSSRQISEKVINYALNWSVRNKSKAIVFNLQGLIINHYDALSLTGIRCIKTYIQMTNPKDKEDWRYIQVSLMRILQNTHISNMFDLNSLNPTAGEFMKLAQESQIQKRDVDIFSNKMVIQKIAIELLPNDSDCLGELLKIYKEIITFNDNIYLRYVLFKKGLKCGNKGELPDLLLLEEIISNRILAIYNFMKEKQVFQYGLSIFQRYSQSAQLAQKFQEEFRNQQSHLSTGMIDYYSIQIKYWQKRKIPLLKIINYLLPKLKRLVSTHEQQLSIMFEMLEAVKYVESRDPFVKAIRQISLIG